MSAIRNVGELASPYFLLEVWVRREEINIDPETFATLKRKARSLVRDARGFELRDEEPDDEWRVRRRDLLAVDDLRSVSVADEETPFDVGIWSDEKEVESLVVGDLVGFTDPDRRTQDGVDPPATAFELALDHYDGDADWGVLLAGLEVRVYRRSSGISQQYLAVDLDTLVELDDDAAWKAFAAIFRAPAFAPAADGVPLVRRVVDESRRHASALAADMRRDVVDAAEAIIQGVLNHADNQDVTGPPTRDVLHRLFEESLYYLYRVLFGMYAESRDVLPVSGQGPYATTYSVDHLVELARRGGARPQGRYYDDSVKTWFDLLWDGPPEVTARLGFNPVGGELFDPNQTPTLDRCVIPDPAWERALTSIALGAPDSPRRRLGRRSSFAELGVDQLGSIYEGLLVLEPYLATEDAYLGTYKNERRIFSDQDIDGFKVLRHLHAGDFVLESAGGRRKGSGSFYTPHEITEYLTHAALDPLIEPILAKAKDDPDAAAHELLDLNVCDPAMGSGAFLVQAARVLALALARIRSAKSDGLVTPDRVQHAKREVVRQCLYGVDLNPLAVALAKVSLWLETLEPGRPLSFLDAHLRCGDSLVGVSFRDAHGNFTAAELATFPLTADKGLKTYLDKEAGEQGEPVLERLKKRSKPKSAKQAQLPGIDRSEVEGALEKLAAEREEIATLEEQAETLLDVLDAKESFEKIEAASDSIRNRLRRAADFWCAQWFSDGEDAPSDANGPVVPASVGDFEQTVSALVDGRPVPEACEILADAADDVSRRRRFFHWELEFPEIFFDQGGFDAVLGNPPWNTLDPVDDEFFSTFDPNAFQKKVSRRDKGRRKAELRENHDIDAVWRQEARYLHELSSYARPESNRFRWHAPDGQMRKGRANVFRLFVERGFNLLRLGGRLSQVLPDSFYVSSPAAGLRMRLMEDGVLDRCLVFENRKKLFPIDGRIKVVLLSARRGGGPTDRFKAAFFVGKDGAGRDRSVGLGELPAVLAELEGNCPTLSREQIKALSPGTLAFPELKSSLDAQIVTGCASRVPPLNLNGDGWGLVYCDEINATNDAWRFHEEPDLVAAGATRDGIRWATETGDEYWPVVSGTHLYHLEFPVDPAEFRYWVLASELRQIESRRNNDGSTVFDHHRVVWREVASATNERSAISAILPPRCVATHKAPTSWGGSTSLEQALKLCALLSSFVFDYLVRFKGATSLKHRMLNPIPAPAAEALDAVVLPAVELVCQSPELGGLWPALGAGPSPPVLDDWAISDRRAQLDGMIGDAYGVSIDEFAAVLTSFPNLDRSQPMLPGEPKCFVTRDLALRAFCEVTGTKKPDVAKLMREIGSGLPDPAPEYRDLDARIEAYKELGAVPYRPTPKGARIPIDPSVVENVKLEVSDDPMTVAEIAEAVGEEEDLVKKILRDLKKSKEIFSEGRGAKTRYYRVEEL